MLVRWLALSVWLVACTGWAETGKVIKVLPQFLDLKGRTSLSPSLFDRDAYQAVLREHPEQRSGMRFFVQWKAKGTIWEPLYLRLELRGTATGDLPKKTMLEQRIDNPGGLFSHWNDLTLGGDQYQKFGPVTAWRVTLWEGDKLLGEQKSFLW
jgi:hypothetical protein